MSDDRWTEEQKAAHEAAPRECRCFQVIGGIHRPDCPITRRTPPRRRHVDRPTVTVEEIEAFMKKLKVKK